MRIWLAPLAAAENGFPAGTVPGENAIDTKASSSLPRATLIIRDTTASGFRGGLISNMAAFNLKENVAVTVDGVTVYDSEIAFRLRGPGTSTTGGAWVTVKNAVVYDTTVAFRYEGQHREPQDLEQHHRRRAFHGRSWQRRPEAAVSKCGTCLIPGGRPSRRRTPRTGVSARRRS